MKVRNRAKESDEAVFANAWRVVVSDPNYKRHKASAGCRHRLLPSGYQT
jgi:hypothetical protein